MGDDVTGEALREAMVAYRTRWEDGGGGGGGGVARNAAGTAGWRRLTLLLIAMSRAMGTFEAIVQYNEADVQPVRERWRMLKEKVKS
jgi:hypothetical protein